MATGEQLIERLGGGGTVGLAVAAVVLAPTLLPPVRRGLRGLAKAAIIQYLKVSELRAPAALEDEETAASTPPARGASRRRRTERTAATQEVTSAAEGRSQSRQGRAAAAPEPAARPVAPSRAPRRGREQAAANTEAATPAEAPARAPRTRRGAASGAEQPAAAAGGPVGEGAPAVGAETGREAGEGRRRGAPDGKLNLNTATRAELTRLPRVGAQTADRIIQFRQEQGPIRNLRQLRQADILSLAAYRQIRDLVRL